MKESKKRGFKGLRW